VEASVFSKEKIDFDQNQISLKFDSNNLKYFDEKDEMKSEKN